MRRRYVSYSIRGAATQEIVHRHVSGPCIIVVEVVLEGLVPERCVRIAMGVCHENVVADAGTGLASDTPKQSIVSDSAIRVFCSCQV